MAKENSNVLSVKEAQGMLIDEFEMYPYVYDGPLGHAGTDIKIRNLIFACIRENLSKSECSDLLNGILSLYQIEEKDKMDIQYLVELYYAAKELIDSGYYTFR